MRRNKTEPGKTGIEKSLTDKVQPFRVYFKGNIIKFVKTEEEACRILKEEKAKEREKKR